ncbi:(2Fe-2S)-binding protein [Hymenobacter busanensis]|uniref:(2Fe-2S)-binding protein n=1 Tax=Hymenobacter busanensis TaxID=2607656 RepID=A0A7L4ZY00_9BACT|nr:2Fe-2S iron-sulfur cluster-binding protein [Hymenobacter busanensis]KAA9325302.1 (2Fe-2S)-binding protein [Hymenobacter busanensis]QHJ07705.1 2Fe-2S iron-sulfur cluster binding domain-containing protein [Hymenobacter busanensis]
MASLTVQNLPGAPIPVQAGQTLLQALHAAGHDWMHACGARGRCTTCRLDVLGGAESLAPPTAAEQRYHERGRLALTARLTCQAQLPSGDVVGRVPEATKLPHVRYC